MRSSFEPKWHVVYTRPKLERLISTQIYKMGFETYLPLYTVIKQWSDRKKKIEVPLFPNYIFVKIHGHQRCSILGIYGLVSFVSVEKKPVILPDNQINTIRKIMNSDFDVAVDDYFQKGQKIKIIKGQFTDLEGIIIRKNKNFRLLIQINALHKALSVNIHAGIAKILKEVG